MTTTSIANSVAVKKYHYLFVFHFQIKDKKRGRAAALVADEELSRDDKRRLRRASKTTNKVRTYYRMALHSTCQTSFLPAATLSISIQRFLLLFDLRSIKLSSIPHIHEHRSRRRAKTQQMQLTTRTQERRRGGSRRTRGRTRCCALTTAWSKALRRGTAAHTRSRLYFSRNCRGQRKKR